LKKVLDKDTPAGYCLGATTFLREYSHEPTGLPFLEVDFGMCQSGVSYLA